MISLAKSALEPFVVQRICVSLSIHRRSNVVYCLRRMLTEFFVIKIIISEASYSLRLFSRDDGIIYFSAIHGVTHRTNC